MVDIPIADGLFTWGTDDPRLIGSRCRECGRIAFPRTQHCPACCASAMEDMLLSRRGTLWTWTTQGFLPKSPPYAGPETAADFKPYAVGYVELPGEVRVESRILTDDPRSLSIGMDMELVIVPYKTDVAGRTVLSFAFQPVTSK